MSTTYGLSLLPPEGEGDDLTAPPRGAKVFKIEVEDDGSVFVTDIATFKEVETAHRFCEVWNGGDPTK